jgi:hypothetical protein
MNTQVHGPGAGAAGDEQAEGQDRRKSFYHRDVLSIKKNENPATKAPRHKGGFN